MTIINASAGSGKTYALAVAYLGALLLPQADGRPTAPQNVLATTFTRAAASEILERVLRRLAEAVVSEPQRVRLLEEINRPELGREDLEQLLGSVCAALPRLQMGTIDALFARIVRVLGLDLAFPATWTVADETHAAELALEAADRMLRGPDVQLSREQWRRFAQFKLGVAVRAILVQMLETNRFHLIDAPIDPDDPALAEPMRLALDEATQLIAGLENFDVPVTKAKKTPNVRWVAAIDKIKDLLSGEPPLTAILHGHALMGKILAEGGTYYSIPVPAELRELLSPLLNRARDDLRRLHAARLPALAALSRKYHEIRRGVAYAGGAFSFSEVEAAVRELPPHIYAQDLYFRLDGRIQHLLLDEFQDTSLGQFRFLWPIIQEVQSGNRLFFAVGDPKQAIYGWRGADRHLLERLPGWLGPEVEPLTRSENYRSSPAVLAAINRVFEQLEQSPSFDPALFPEDKREHVTVCQRAAASFAGSFQPHVAVGDNRHLAGRVCLHVVTRDETEKEVAQIEAILTTIQNHRREDPNREIAVLLRRRKWIPQLVARLRRDGIEASGEGGSAVVDSAAVELVLSMLTWLDHPGHSLAQGHVESSGLPQVFELNKPGEIHHRTHAAVLRRGLAAVLGGWIWHADFQARCSVHDKVRCGQLVELARRWDVAGGGRLAHFVYRVRSQRLENPLSSRLRVMTIHGAKGLEFQAVIVGDLPSRRGGPRSVQLVSTMSSPEEPLQVRLLPSRAQAELLGERDLYEQFEQEQFEEGLSVLYVALTRAKRFLDVIVAESDKPSASLEGLLRERWDHSAVGDYVVETCEAGAPVPAAVHVMANDAVIASGSARLDASRFALAPARLAEVTPSGNEGGGRVPLRFILSDANVQARAAGTTVHELLAQIEWNDRLPALEDWVTAVTPTHADAMKCREAASALLPRLKSAQDALGAVFDRERVRNGWKKERVKGLELWRERRFAVVQNADLVSGSFDRVVFALDANGQRIRAVIYDFKTDPFQDAREKKERERLYRPQLDAYATALAQLTGLGADHIEAQLVWLNEQLRT